jgi:hypothetical protein
LNTPDDELSPSEQEQMKKLAVEAEPSAGLEDRVLRAMRSRGIVRKSSWLRSFAAVAAAITLFVAGIVAGRYWPVTAPRDPRPQFVLMLYEDSNYETASSAELPGRIAEYGGWARSLGSQNYVSGQKLVESESTVSRSGIVGPTPPAQKDGSVAGYFIIRAADAGEAARVASTCPHVRYGGLISVREVER